MTMRTLRLALIILLGALGLYLTTSSGAQAQGTYPPAPLPHDCGGVTPLGEPPCCVYGYVYYEGVPVAGADVTVVSSHGQSPVVTGQGPNSDFPYYSSALSYPPLNVQVGETITVTASYRGRAGTRTHTVREEGQQVDLVLLVPGVDLTVHSIAVEPPDVAPNTPFATNLAVLNQGDTGSKGFATYLYVDHPQPPSLVTQPTSSTHIPSLPGAWNFEWRREGARLAAGCHTIWAWVDRDDEIPESDEANNLSSITLCVGVSPPCQPDAHEPDPSCYQAQEIGSEGGHQLRNFCQPADVDWTRFEATAGVTYTIQAKDLGTDAATELSLYNSCPTNAVLQSGGSLTWVAPADGTYYLKTQHRGEASPGPDTRYDLSVTASADCPGDLFEPDNACSMARDFLPEGEGQTRRFCRPADQDWIQFAAQGGASYAATTDKLGTDASPLLSVFAGCGTPAIAERRPEALWTAPTNGVYYIKVENAASHKFGPAASYDVSVAVTGCGPDQHEPDDSRETARMIGVDVVPDRHQFCPASDQDWVRFTAAAGARYILSTANLGPTADTELCLYAAAGVTPIQCDDDGGGGRASRLIWLASATGDYYVQVRHPDAAINGPGTSYDLSVARQLCAGDAFEPDDDAAHATAIVVDGPGQSHTSCPAADEDWVRFELAADQIGEYVIETSGLGPGADTLLALLAADGVTELAFNDDYGEGTASRITVRLDAPGAYYARGTHFSAQQFGADTSYRLSVARGKVTPTPTPTPTPVPSPTPNPPTSSLKTLILVNRAQVAALYGETAAASLMARLQDLAAYQPAPGIVVQVEANAATAAAYARWQADTGSTIRANDVASAIRGLVMQYAANNPSVEYIIIVGDDRVIPYRRTPDRTTYPESQYAARVSPDTTLQSACADDMTLTDDYYADREPTAWLNRELYLPDYAVGRLVQTPAEISGQIDAFLANHRIETRKALVAGYEFVQDGAQKMCNQLRGDLGSTGVDCALIGDTWRGSDLRTGQLDMVPRFDVQAIAGHATHRVEGSPDGSGVSAADVTSFGRADLTGAVVYAVGCHTGFNDVGPEEDGVGLDLAQAFARRKANYIANTGFGWGYRFAVGLSEQLMVDFTRQLLSGGSVRIGQALQAAKQRYYAQSVGFDDFDGKTLAQATLYGIPMYELTSGATLGEEDPFPSVNVASTIQGTLGGLVEEHLTISLKDGVKTLKAETVGESVFYALDQHTLLQANDPVQPLFFSDAAKPLLGTPRGAVWTSGRYADRHSFEPLIAQPMNEYHAVAETGFDAPGWYPALPFAVNSGGAASLALALGQYRSTDRTERLYDQMSFDLYYSDAADRSAPAISLVTWQAGPPATHIKVACDDPSGIHRVIATYTTGSGGWSSVDLRFDAVRRKWIGDVPTRTYWLVQVVDGAGNVAVAHNKGSYYTAERANIYNYLPVILQGS